MSASPSAIPGASGVPKRGPFATLAGRRRATGWLMALPAIAVIVALSVFPLIYSLTISFQRRDLQHPRDNAWVWFKNYARAISNADDRVWQALKNTVMLAFGGVAIEFVLGLALALVLVEELRGKRYILPILMLPVMMVPVVVALIWRMLWDNHYGAINEMLSKAVGHQVNIIWLAKTDSSLFAVLVTQVWQWTPFMFLVLLAGLASVPPDLYEAAALDGASWWNSFKDITLPGLRNVIAVALLFRLVDAFKIFDLIAMMTQGQPGTSTETLSWYIYDRGHKAFVMGYASAVSYLFLILVTIFATVYVGRLLRGEEL